VDANQSTAVDAATYAKLINPTNPEMLEALNEILSILKKNGGLPAGLLK